MALNIKDPETERLAAEVAGLAGDTKSGAIKRALLEYRLLLLARQARDVRKERLTRLLENEIWPQIPESALGKGLTKDERGQILGYGPEGV